MVLAVLAVMVVGFFFSLSSFHKEKNVNKLTIICGI